MPLVILSCALRTINLPLLALQGGLIFYGFRGLDDSLFHLTPSRIASLTIALPLAMGSAVLILVCFLVGAINQECAGKAQQKIGFLERARKH